MDPDNASMEKTVTLSKVEAQTPEDLTLYGASHQHEVCNKKAVSGSVLPPHLLWQGVYTIKFKKVPGPAGGSGEMSEPVVWSRSPTPTLSSLPEDAPHAKILQLI
ncbi:hypothetical protein EI94DRAFT_1703828 [Lactarius quietus]|nr:hypothetical protein EI94DRAFT_1703828 [Lactarius quietus]